MMKMMTEKILPICKLSYIIDDTQILDLIEFRANKDKHFHESDDDGNNHLVYYKSKAVSYYVYCRYFNDTGLRRRWR